MLIIFIFVPPRSSSSLSRRRAHHLHLRAAPIIFIFAPPHSSPSSLRRRTHHLLRAAALIIFILAPSGSSCFQPSIFIRLVARLGKFHPPAPPSLHSFDGSRQLHCRNAISSFSQQCHRAAISSFVRLVHRSPRHNLFSGPANLIAAPQSFQRAGQSHRCAAIITVGRRIPSPCRNYFTAGR